MNDSDRYLIGHTVAQNVMLAHDFDPASYAADTEYMVSAKLDGLRAIYAPGAGFFSRSGLPYNSALTAHIEIDPRSSYILDGEFYCHGMSLQDINAAMAINRSSPTESTKKIQFHAFDSPNAGHTFRERHQRLATHPNLLRANCSLVGQVDCRCWAQLINCFQAHVALGYEGSMLRVPYGGYVNGRSNNLLKWKANQTFDATSVRMDEGVGKFNWMLGAMHFVNRKGIPFAVGSGWTDEERKEIWANKEAYLGREATIKCMTLSNDGTPKMSTFMCWNQ